MITELVGGPTVAQWSVWSSTARVVVTEPAALDAAVAVVRRTLSEVDDAASRFRPDSELAGLVPGEPTLVSALLADLVGVALTAARRTGGDVDPTVGAALSGLGYDRDLSLVDVEGLAVPLVVRSAPGWRSVRLAGRVLTVPPGVELDLGATAKARAADLAAALVAESVGTGVLVSLGGDIATAGPAPERGWRVLVQDQPDDPPARVLLAGGHAIATSSTRSRTWRRGGTWLHHILDPRTCLPVQPLWHSATVVAPSCVEANTASTAALVRGAAAPAFLDELGHAARLLAADGTVRTTGGWPR